MVNNIDKLRKKAGITIDQLAERTGYSKSYINKLKAAKKRLNSDVLEKLAAALHCNPSDFLGDAPRAQYFGKVGAGWTVTPIDDMPKMHVRESGHLQPDDPTEFVDAPPGAPHGMGCVDVDGDSMKPFLKKGDRVFFLERNRDFEKSINEPAIVWLKDGRFAIKILRRSKLYGRYDLDSFNEELLKDCELEWVARIKYTEYK